MNNSENPVLTIEEYINNCPIEVQLKLNEIYKTIKESAPEATEKISWGMPTFVYHGNLIHFAAQKKHIGLHPAPSAIQEFEAEFLKAGYKYSKGTVQLPYDMPLPTDLIQRIVKFRLAEQKHLASEKIKTKENKKK